VNIVPEFEFLKSKYTIFMNSIRRMNDDLEEGAKSDNISNNIIMD